MFVIDGLKLWVLSSSTVCQRDALLLACGSERPRDVRLEGRELGGIHFAMDCLVPQTRRVAGCTSEAEEIRAEGKHVIILGGGDTGSDCVGTAHRQGALSVSSLELMERPPAGRDPSTPWPMWPLMIRASSSHEEGGRRDFGVMTKRFSESNGKVERLHVVREKIEEGELGERRLVENPGSELAMPCDRVLLAVGDLHPARDVVGERSEVDKAMAHQREHKDV